MRKQVTILSGLVLLAGTSFAQQQINVPARKAKLSTITPFNGIESKKPAGVEKADGDIVWQDDFSGTAAWTIATSGQGTFVIGNNTNTQITDATTGLSGYMGAMASTTAANGFAFFNGVQYLIGGTVAAQNTSVTSPVIDFTGIPAISLSFQQRYRAFNTDMTYVEFSADGGTTWTVSELVNTTVVTNAAAVQNTVTLDIPVGGTATGMIRFRWEETTGDANYGSGYGWMVDDVVVREGYGNNLSMLFTYSSVGTQGLQYTKFPVGQVTGAGDVSFGAEVKNVGYNSQDVQLHVTAGTYDFTGTPAVTIAPFTTDSVDILTADGYTIPATAGVYDFTFEAVAATTLVQTTDDAATAGFEVTPNTYAVDAYDGTAASMDGTFTGWASGSGDPAIGTLFEIFQDGEIGSVDVGIGNISSSQQATYVGREFLARIYILNATGDFEYYDETPSHILAATDFGKIVKLKLVNATIPVAANTTYLVVAASYLGSEVPFAFSGFSQAGTTLGLDGQDPSSDITRLASDAATPNIVEAPVVRLDFQSYVGLNEIDNVAGVTTAPNPFTNSTEISFSLKADAQVSVVVTDMTGRQVMNIPASSYNAGAHKIALDGAAFNAGVYNYTLTVGNNIITKRIVKK